MGSTEGTETPRKMKPYSKRAYLLTSPRTASNLFIRMLNLDGRTDVATRPAHKGLTGGGYFYGEAMDFQDDNFNVGTPVNQLSDADKQQIGAAYQDATDEFVSVVLAGERQDKIVFIKEHIVNMTKPALQSQILHGTAPNSVASPWTIHIDRCDDHVSPSNPLFLPDQWLQSFMPTILIRHPGVAFPSEYRAEVIARQAYQTEMRDAYSSLVSTNVVVRQLYDFYRAHHLDQDPDSPWPLVIDAADLIADPEPYMNRFCDLAGIDRSQLRYSWKPLDGQQRQAIGDRAVLRFMSTLNDSSAVQKDKAHAVVDVDAEVAKIAAEFGHEVGRKMDGWIRASLADYEYLKSKCWKPSG